MYSLNASLPAMTVAAKQPSGQIEQSSLGRIQLSKSGLALPITLSLGPRCGKGISLAGRPASAGVTCSSALNARCSTEQQTIQHQSAVITNAPVQGKEKSPELDDGGTGLPPRDDGDGGGGGGGGGGGWTGGFFFFGLLAFLGFLKDQESEGPYSNDKRR